jgi:hypothetical protein
MRVTDARAPYLSLSRLASPLLRWSLQEFCRLGIEYGCEFAKHVKARAVDAALQGADVRSIYFGIMSEGFLG